MTDALHMSFLYHTHGKNTIASQISLKNQSVETSTNVIWISGTVDRSASWHLADAAAYALGISCVCKYQIAALFCVKWRHGCHHESVTSNRKSHSVNWSLFILRTICQILSKSDFNRQSLRHFWRASLQSITRRTATTWVAIWDRFLIQKCGSKWEMLLCQ